MNESTLVRQDKATSFAVAFEHARNNILRKFAPMRHTVHGVGNSGHTNRISAGAFTLDGKNLLTASSDGTAILWNLETGLPIRQFVGHEGSIQCLCLTSDARRFMTGGDDGTARLWDIPTGKCIHVFRGHKAAVETVCVTADGKNLITGSLDTKAVIWSMRTLSPVRILEGHTDRVSSICMSPDEEKVITADYGGDIRIWEILSGKLIKVLQYPDLINRVCTTPDGNLLAAYGDNSSRLWSLEGKCLRVYRYHQSTMLRIVAEEENSFVAGCHYVNSRSVRENATKLSLVASCSFVAAPAKGNYFFSTGWDGTCRQISYDGVEMRIFKGHNGPVETVMISPDGKIATGGWDEQCLLWGIETARPKKAFKSWTKSVNSLALTPDGQALVTAGARSAIVWDLKEGYPKFTLSGHAGRVNAVAYSPDGRYTMTSSSDHSVIIRDAETATREGIFECSTTVSQAICSPDMTLMAAAGLDGSVTLFDFRSRMPIRKLGEHGRGLSCVIFTPDSNRIAVASGDGTACMYDVRTGRQVLCLVHDDEVRCMSINENGSLIATGSLNGDLRLWNLTNGQMIFTIRTAHQGGVNAVAFDLRGDRIISGGHDGLVRVWGCAEPQCKAIGRGHRGEVTSIALSPCGKRIFSGSEDHTVNCWGLSQKKFSEREKGEMQLDLLATMHNLEKGFLWTTPPDPKLNAESGWFWTDRHDLIHVTCRTEDTSNEAPVSGKEKNDYISIYCQKDMVMSRISAKNQEHLASQIRYAINGAREESLRYLEVSLRQRLASG